MNFFKIGFGYLKPTSATPGLSNPCKLRFKSNIAGIFVTDIYRVVGDITSFLTTKKPVYKNSMPTVSSHRGAYIFRKIFFYTSNPESRALTKFKVIMPCSKNLLTLFKLIRDHFFPGGR